MKHHHQLYEDCSLRSNDRISQFSTLPENELKYFESSIGQQIFALNQVISTNNTTAISNEIVNLYNLIDRGVSISGELFNNELFIKSLNIILFSPAFCISACKLLSRILYYTNQFGVVLHDFAIPLFNLFLENANNPEIELIINTLCNLSYDLLSYEFKDDYYDKNKVHPLKTIARNCDKIIQIANGPNFQITLTYILFIRNVSNYIYPSDEEPFNIMIQYFKSLLFNLQIQQNDQFVKIILWTLYDICNKFLSSSLQPFFDIDFILFLVSLMKEKNFLFCEPIFGIFYHIICCFETQDNRDNMILDNFDLPFIYHICLTVNNDPIQYEAIQLINKMTELFPAYMYSHDVINLLTKISNASLSYKVKNQIIWTACNLISRNDISYLTPESMMILLEFIITNARSDEANEYLAIESIVYFMRTMCLYNKRDLCEQMIDESGARDFIEELRDSDNDEIFRIIQYYDNVSNDSTAILHSLQVINEHISPAPGNEEQLSSDDVDLVEYFDLLDDDADNDNSIPSPLPKITFYCGSKPT